MVNATKSNGTAAIVSHTEVEYKIPPLPLMVSG